MTDTTTGRNVRTSKKRCACWWLTITSCCRSGLVGSSTSLPACEVCGEAATSEDALRVAADTQPDVIIIDVSLGLEVASTSYPAHQGEMSRGESAHVVGTRRTCSSPSEAKRVGALGYGSKGVLRPASSRRSAASPAGDTNFVDTRDPNARAVGRVSFGRGRRAAGCRVVARVLPDCSSRSFRIE